MPQFLVVTERKVTDHFRVEANNAREAEEMVLSKDEGAHKYMATSDVPEVVMASEELEGVYA